jgi:sulfonate transport system permease protein
VASAKLLGALSILIFALLGKLADSASRALERLTLSWHPAFRKH